MKKRPAIFWATLASLTFATLLTTARSEPAKSSTASIDEAGKPAQPEPATEPAAAPSPKANGMKKAAQGARLSFGVDEVVKMYQGGVETDVILNYVENSSVPYHLSAEEIVRLHEIGVPSPVITTMIRHGAKVQQQAIAATAQMQQKASEEAKAASANYNPYSPVVYAPPAPAVTYSYNYPTYAYSSYPGYYSSYYYPRYYSPRYCYTSPFYFGYSYPRHFYSYSRFGCSPHFGFGARFGHSPRFGIGVRF